ncbi:MAG: CBS domain-containing protein [Alphaproteobacteria bacterium]|nr:CBS domain-containing protein [Alphaproteobacteria bacterium]
MNSSDSQDAGEPPSRLGRLLRRPRRGAGPAEATSARANGNGAHAHADMRLRLAEFEAGTVADVMIPRADIVAVEVSTPFDEAMKTFAREAHSRLPVYRQTLDDPIGFVHIKDIVAELARDDGPAERSPLEKLRRDMLYVPPSMPLADLLVKMQSTRIHMALVVDEYGGTDGLVSLENLVEEIVGDIEDEHDEEAATLLRRGRNVFEVDARMEIDDFAEETGVNLALPDLEDELDTLGGIAFALAGRVPVRGEVLRHPGGCDMEIMEADTRRIRRLRLRMPGAAATRVDLS